MGDLGLSNDINFEGVEHESYKYNPSHGQLLVGDNQFSFRKMKFVEADLLLADLHISSVEVNLNALHLQEVENFLDSQSTCSSTSNKKISEISSPNIEELLNLSRCASMLCSEALKASPSVFAKEESSIIELGFRSSLSAGNLKDELPFQDPSKPVSALKGSRARQGKPLDPNLHVKWAADVYDPPVTSSSHTVKGHRHHHNHRPPRAKKDHQKHRHTKSSQRRNSNSGSLSDPRLPRRQALSGDQPDFRGSKEESNCAGRSLHIEPLWPFSRHVAEAS